MSDWGESNSYGSLMKSWNHIKNPEQTDYVWLVNQIFLPYRTILPENLGSFLFLMKLNFLPHFDRFLLIGFFIKHVQNITRNKSVDF